MSRKRSHSSSLNPYSSSSNIANSCNSTSEAFVTPCRNESSSLSGLLETVWNKKCNITDGSTDSREILSKSIFEEINREYDSILNKMSSNNAKQVPSSTATKNFSQFTYKTQLNQQDSQKKLNFSCFNQFKATETEESKEQDFSASDDDETHFEYSGLSVDKSLNFNRTKFHPRFGAAKNSSNARQEEINFDRLLPHFNTCSKKNTAFERANEEKKEETNGDNKENFNFNKFSQNAFGKRRASNENPLKEVIGNENNKEKCFLNANSSEIIIFRNENFPKKNIVTTDDHFGTNNDFSNKLLINTIATEKEEMQGNINFGHFVCEHNKDMEIKSDKEEFSEEIDYEYSGFAMRNFKEVKKPKRLNFFENHAKDAFIFQKHTAVAKSSSNSRENDEKRKEINFDHFDYESSEINLDKEEFSEETDYEYNGFAMRNLKEVEEPKTRRVFENHANDAFIFEKHTAMVKSRSNLRDNGEKRKEINFDYESNEDVEINLNKEEFSEETDYEYNGFAIRNLKEVEESKTRNFFENHTNDASIFQKHTAVAKSCISSENDETRKEINFGHFDYEDANINLDKEEFSEEIDYEYNGFAMPNLMDTKTYSKELKKFNIFEDRGNDVEKLSRLHCTEDKNEDVDILDEYSSFVFPVNAQKSSDMENGFSNRKVGFKSNNVVAPVEKRLKEPYNNIEKRNESTKQNFQGNSNEDLVSERCNDEESSEELNYEYSGFIFPVSKQKSSKTKECLHQGIENKNIFGISQNGDKNLFEKLHNDDFPNSCETTIITSGEKESPEGSSFVFPVNDQKHNFPTSLTVNKNSKAKNTLEAGQEEEENIQHFVVSEHLLPEGNQKYSQRSDDDSVNTNWITQKLFQDNQPNTKEESSEELNNEYSGFIFPVSKQKSSETKEYLHQKFFYGISQNGVSQDKNLSEKFHNDNFLNSCKTIIIEKESPEGSSFVFPVNDQKHNRSNLPTSLTVNKNSKTKNTLESGQWEEGNIQDFVISENALPKGNQKHSQRYTKEESSEELNYEYSSFVSPVNNRSNLLTVNKNSKTKNSLESSQDEEQNIQCFVVSENELPKENQKLSDNDSSNYPVNTNSIQKVFRDQTNEESSEELNYEYSSFVFPVTTQQSVSSNVKKLGGICTNPFEKNTFRPSQGEEENVQYSVLSEKEHPVQIQKHSQRSDDYLSNYSVNTNWIMQKVFQPKTNEESSEEFSFHFISHNPKRFSETPEACKIEKDIVELTQDEDAHRIRSSQLANDTNLITNKPSIDKMLLTREESNFVRDHVNTDKDKLNNFNEESDFFNHLTSADEKLRKGIDFITKDVSLLYSGGDHSMTNESKKSILKRKLESIFDWVMESLVSHRPLCFEVRDNVHWENCTFRDSMLKQNKNANVRITKINYNNRSGKFNLVFYLLCKCYCLMQDNSTCTQREMYYQIKNFLTSKDVIMRTMTQISILLDIEPWYLPIVPSSKGLVFGELLLEMSDYATVSCNAFGGTVIPQDVTRIQNIQTKAKFILVVEKDAIFKKLLDEGIPNKLGRPFILITGKGFPDINTRFFVRTLWMRLKVPVFILVDADPHGIDIMLTYRFGSVTMAYLSEQLVVPQMRWLGVFPSEIGLLNVTRQPLTALERRKISLMLQRPYVDDNPWLKRELGILEQDGFKAEIEGMIKSRSFLTDFYLTTKFYSCDYV